ncbi:MAG: flippase-like domain-containing protein [Thermoanaerobaculales bacterium]|nr:flippase-like domain-containing protein [Thermoanaerobaculales bacterium]
MNRAVRIAVSLTLMVILLAVFLWNVNFAEVGQSIASADPMYLAGACLVALLAYFLRALRWTFILLPVKRVRLSSVLLTTAVGYAALSLLPARMGDLIRPLLLARREHFPASASLASILTERVFDLWSVVFFFLLFIIWPPAMPDLGPEASHNLEVLSISGYVAGAGLLIGTLVLLGLFRYQDRFIEVLTRPVGRIRESWRQPATNFLEHFLDGMRVIQRPRDLLITTLASLVMWYVIFWQVQMTLFAFDVHVPLRATFLIVTLTVIGLAVPTPGGVGGFHKASQIGLTMFFGIELNRATAIAIAYHAICFVPITIIGLLGLPLLGIKPRDVGSLSTGEEVEA